MSSNNKNTSSSSEDARPLPESFSPTDKDVICGWARQNHHHSGNKRFRDLIDEFAPLYLKASTKLEKSQVIAEVIDKVRNESPDGGFVKKDFYTGKWYEIGNEKARDKVGHAIRKASEEIQRASGTPRKKPSKKAKETARKASAQQNVTQPMNLHGPLSTMMSHQASSAQQDGPLATHAALNSSALSNFPAAFNAHDFVSSHFASRRTLPEPTNIMIDGQLVPGILGARPMLYPQSTTQLYNMAPNLRELQDATGGAQLSRASETTSSFLGTAAASASASFLPDGTSSMSGIPNRFLSLRELEMQHSLSLLGASIPGHGGLAMSPAMSSISGGMGSLEAILASQRNQQGGRPSSSSQDPSYYSDSARLRRPNEEDKES